MAISATEKMLQAVRSAKSSASRAEGEYDRGESMLQIKASRSIDLFGGDAVSRVADIAADARKLCDSLYASYQSLVGMLDSQCRPLLDQEPELHAVKEVRDLIKWLNDESEIESNFTASFNSRSLGGVASGRYVPTIENKMIQRFWESKYDTWPGRAEAEAAARRLREAEMERRRQQAEQRRAEAEARNRKLEEQYREELAVYEQKHADWKAEVAAVQQRRKEGVEKALPGAKDNFIREIEEKRKEAIRQLAHEMAMYQQNKEAAERELAGLGFFHFTEKSTAKRIIADMAYRLSNSLARENAINAEYNRQLAEVPALLKQKKKQFEQVMEKKHPLPAEPKKPSKPRLEFVPGPGSDGMTAMQIANEGIKRAIYDGMVPGQLYTLTDIAESIPEVADLSNQRISALLRQLVTEGALTRTEDKRKAYFSRD